MIRTSVAPVKQLLESGVHFGHQTKRWNPKMKKYIVNEKNGIYIIDLNKTAQCLDTAYDFVVNEVIKNKTIIFVGTKRQAKDCLMEEALRADMPYVNQRWLGGTLTNFGTIKKRIERLEDLEKKKTDGYFENFSKKEAASLDREIAKLKKSLGGITAINHLCNDYISANKYEERKDAAGNIILEFIRSQLVMFVIDPKKEHIAIREGRKLGLPIIALIDTNSNPDEIDYPIPGNDDSIKAVKFMTSKIADAVLEGVEMRAKNAEETKSGKETKKEEAATV